MFKRGYKDGAKIIEIIDGNLDVVLYNEKGTSFYFYRFPPEQVIGIKFKNTESIIDQDHIKGILEQCGKTDYEGFINELIQYAIENNISERYEM